MLIIRLAHLASLFSICRLDFRGSGCDHLLKCFAYASAALSNKERKQGDDEWTRCGSAKEKDRLKSKCFVLECNDHSWLFSSLIMIKVSRGSHQDIVWETDGLLFYCDMTD